MSRDPRPLIGLPSDTFDKDELLFHSVGDKYLRAVADVAGGLPVMVPSLADRDLLAATLDRLDALVVTGATSNVHPPLYGTSASADHEPYDHARDASTFDLITLALEQHVPLLCICRGFQELNVVMGGTLDTEVQEKPGRHDHRAPASPDIDVRYGPAHPVRLTANGQLAAILGKHEIMVNTVHRQAIRDLGAGLTVEAVAPDGTIEAVSVSAARNFALGVQWHPEYKAARNPDSVRLFEAFGQAASRAMTARKAAAPVTEVEA